MVRLPSDQSEKCGDCHKRAATETNKPCNHLWLCNECSDIWRIQKNNICPYPNCKQPSTIVNLSDNNGMRCEKCDKTYSSGFFVRPSDDCCHTRCAPCMLERVQLCIKKKTGFDDQNSNLCKLCKDGIPCHNIPSPRTNGGVRCHWQKDGKTCPARIGRDRLEILKRVTELLAQRFPNQPPLTKPLTNEDMDKYDRLSVEGLIPAHRRVLCVNESCSGKGYAVDSKLSEGEHKHSDDMSFACPYCDTLMCRQCR